MRRSSSINTTLQDLENAIKFLNKELSVRDIENIYGDFNDPTFQAALKEVKGNLDDITRAVNLRNLVLLKNAYEKWADMLVSKIKSKVKEIAAKETELKKLDEIADTLTKMSLDDLSNEELLLVAKFTKQYGNQIEFQKKRNEILGAMNKKLENISTQLSRVEKQIYATQMQTLVNVMQDMFTMVLDNIIY